MKPWMKKGYIPTKLRRKIEEEYFLALYEEINKFRNYVKFWRGEKK